MATTIEASPAHRERNLQELAPRSYFSLGSEALALSIDILSLGRNSSSAGSFMKGAEATAKMAPAIGGMVIAGGAMAFLAGGTMLKSSIAGMRTAYERGNWEGGFSNFSLAASGAAYSLTGTGMVVAQSASFATAAAAAAAGTAMFTGGGLALYGGITIYGTYGLAINSRFRQNLNQILKISGTESTKLHAALEWIHDQVVQKEGNTDFVLHKKWDQFASRTSEEVCRYVRVGLTTEFLKKVKGNDLEAIAKAKLILEEVKRANAKQIVKNTLLLVISAIGIAAIVLGIIFATGPFAPILFAISAALWLFFDSTRLQAKFCNFFCGESQIHLLNIKEPPSIHKQVKTAS